MLGNMIPMKMYTINSGSPDNERSKCHRKITTKTKPRKLS